MKKRFRIIVTFILIVVFSITINYLPNIGTVKAASISSISATVTSMKAAVADTDVTFKFTTPTGVAYNQNIVFTFPTSPATLGCSHVGAAYDTLSYGPTTGLENSLTSTGTSGGSGTWGVATSGQTLTLYAPTGSSGSVPAGSIIVWTLSSPGGITKPATAGTYVITINGTFGDTGSVAIVLTASDQVSVSANVDPTLAFTMTPTTLLFGALTTANIRYADSTGGLTTIPAQAATPLLTASTNGVSGVLISVYDAGNGTGGLYSSTVSDLIPAAAVNGLVAGNKKFGVTGLSGSSLTAAAGFNGTGAGGTGVISNVAQSFASSAGPVASGNIAMIMVASIDALTKAGAYSDTVTVICTGRF